MKWSHFLICCSSNAIKKTLLPIEKNQNGGLIQDGNENIFYFLHNKPPF
jgi:hypothetical protein